MNRPILGSQGAESALSDGDVLIREFVTICDAQMLGSRQMRSDEREKGRIIRVEESSNPRARAVPVEFSRYSLSNCKRPFPPSLPPQRGRGLDQSDGIDKAASLHEQHTLVSTMERRMQKKIPIFLAADSDKNSPRISGGRSKMPQQLGELGYAVNMSARSGNTI
ncbi:hypothetical protein BD779DRAFT_249862 [Infundibulicybe gibba]|nr:hypothetical protein BD779DRAFT_249862 [Infundibulicybe gibba]